MQLAMRSAVERSNTVSGAVTADLAWLRTAIVNVFFYGRPGQPGWVLIDTGVYGSARSIARMAEERFGAGVPPSAILLTHGHFDHIGAVRELAEKWDVPVYAHALELPYITGRQSYPPPDPTVGGGAMAALSWLYPRGPINLGDRAQALPEDGGVPFMPGWRWLHTPGHTIGHVSFFRDSDRTLIAGDAVITTKQESALAVFTQRPELHGPPTYYTPDWSDACRSVELLASLEPRSLATGHGLPLSGPEVAAGLHELARHFNQLAVPRQGRYVGRPVKAMSNNTKAMLALGAGLVAAGFLARR